jgi:hypothetical protein
MILPRSKRKKSLVEIDLSGPDGNAFNLLAYAKKFSRTLCYSKEKKNEILSDMMSSDYDNLLNVFDNNFGNFVILYK